MKWTTQQAADAAGLSVGAFRTLAARARKAGRDLRSPARTWPDRRTPLYDADAVFAELARRPGRGRPGAAGEQPADRPKSDDCEQLTVEP